MIYDWTRDRINLDPKGPGRQRLAAITLAADPDPWRRISEKVSISEKGCDAQFRNAPVRPKPEAKARGEGEGLRGLGAIAVSVLMASFVSPSWAARASMRFFSEPRARS